MNVIQTDIITVKIKISILTLASNMIGMIETGIVVVVETTHATQNTLIQDAVVIDLVRIR